MPPHDHPSYPSPVNVGDRVVVSGTISIINTSGGTTVLDHDGVECQVTKAFWDYEAGWRYHGRVLNVDATDSFREQGDTGIAPEVYREKYPARLDLYKSALTAAETYDPGYVYFCEFDISRDHVSCPTL